MTVNLLSFKAKKKRPVLKEVDLLPFTHFLSHLPPACGELCDLRGTVGMLSNRTVWIPLNCIPLTCGPGNVRLRHI